LLGTISIVLAVEMKSLLLGESAVPEAEAAIRAAVINAPPVRSIIHLRTEHVGPERLLVGLKVHFDEDLSVAALSRAIDNVEVLIRSAVPEAEYIYIEPDIRRPDGPPTDAGGEGTPPS
jgi:divalent metal cation (Fe/Co/Zn/Cd) transporter